MMPPKCYTWLESCGSQLSDGKHEKLFFCILQSVGFSMTLRTDIFLYTEKLSYFFQKHHCHMLLYLWRQSIHASDIDTKLQHWQASIGPNQSVLYHKKCSLFTQGVKACWPTFSLKCKLSPTNRKLKHLISSNSLNLIDSEQDLKASWSNASWGLLTGNSNTSSVLSKRLPFDFDRL